MKRKYSVENCRTAKQFAKAVRKQGGHVTGGGRHNLMHHSGGGKPVPLSRHRGDIATGTRCSMIGQLLALGFACMPFVCIAVWLLGGVR